MIGKQEISGPILIGIVAGVLKIKKITLQAHTGIV
jgi:hypothetical protein